MICGGGGGGCITLACRGGCKSTCGGGGDGCKSTLRVWSGSGRCTLRVCDGGGCKSTLKLNGGGGGGGCKSTLKVGRDSENRSTCQR